MFYKTISAGTAAFVLAFFTLAAPHAFAFTLTTDSGTNALLPDDLQQHQTRSITPIKQPPTQNRARFLTPLEIRAIERQYGALPGGIVLESTPMEPLKIDKLIVDLGKNQALLLPQNIRYQLPVGAADFNTILTGILKDDRLGVSTAGIKSSSYGAIATGSQVYRTLHTADTFLGRLIFGRSIPYKFPPGVRQVRTTERYFGGVLVRMRHSGFQVEGDQLNPKTMQMEIRFHKAFKVDIDKLSPLSPEEMAKIPLAFAQNVLMVQKNYAYFRQEPALALVEAYAEVAAFSRLLKQSGINKTMIEVTGKIPSIGTKPRITTAKPPTERQEKTIKIAAPNQPVVQKKEKKDVAVKSPKPALKKETAEAKFWNAVKDSNDRDMLALYINKFPNGTFVKRAKNLIKAVSGSQAPSPENKSQPIEHQEAQKKASEPVKSKPDGPLVGAWCLRQTRIEVSTTEAKQILRGKRIPIRNEEFQCNEAITECTWIGATGKSGPDFTRNLFFQAPDKMKNEVNIVRATGVRKKTTMILSKCE